MKEFTIFWISLKKKALFFEGYQDQNNKNVVIVLKEVSERVY